jgi:hypothetical protein
MLKHCIRKFNTRLGNLTPIRKFNTQLGNLTAKMVVRQLLEQFLGYSACAMCHRPEKYFNRSLYLWKIVG